MAADSDPVRALKNLFTATSRFEKRAPKYQRMEADRAARVCQACTSVHRRGAALRSKTRRLPKLIPSCASRRCVCRCSLSLLRSSMMSIFKGTEDSDSCGTNCSTYPRPPHRLQDMVFAEHRVHGCHTT